VTALRGPVLADGAMGSSIYPLPGFVHPGLSIDTGNGSSPIRYIIATAWYPQGTPCTGRSPCGTLVVSPIARIRARMDVEEPVWHGQIASK